MSEFLDALDRSDSGHKTLPRILSLPASRPGMYTGALFAVLTLFPSMLPKSGITQGVVLGLTFMVGYSVGAAWQWVWHFLELAPPGGRLWRSAVWVAAGFLVVLSASNTWRYVGWQNLLRESFGMAEVTPMIWLVIIPVSLAIAFLILVVVRSVRKSFNGLARWFDRYLPRRLALLLGGVTILALFVGLWSGVLVDSFFATANWFFQPLDASTDEGINQPASPNRSGSPESLVDWETLGRQGRNFVATGPTVEELNAYHGGEAMESIRVYVGLKSADTVEERAQLALDELVRTDAFDREVLVVATTTGTGKLESNAMDSLDYVTNGNVAVAGVQYSYLSSVISLLADEEEVRETSQVVFSTVHAYWSTLPEDARPEIYLYGLSLGSYGVESILSSIDIINGPIDGALMVGPPFVNELWYRLIEGRDPGSTPSTPVYDEGRTVRFSNEISPVSRSAAEWGDTRLLYLQHASDPIVWFSPDLLFRQPDWLYEDKRGHEISEGFIWIPFVTVWQVFTDLASAGAVPDGFGHLYTKQANADGWIAVTRPDPWTDAETERLNDFLTRMDTSD